MLVKGGNRVGLGYILSGVYGGGGEGGMRVLHFRFVVMEGVKTVCRGVPNAE